MTQGWVHAFFSSIIFLSSLQASQAKATDGLHGSATAQGSVGLQLSGVSTNGISGQYKLTNSRSAMNGELGMFFGTLSLAVDWIYHLGSKPPHAAGWHGYLGGGIQTGWFSSLRLLGGFQYEAQENPLNAFAALAIVPTEIGNYSGLILGVRYRLRGF